MLMPFVSYKIVNLIWSKCIYFTYARKTKPFIEVMKNGNIRETPKTTKKDKANER